MSERGQFIAKHVVQNYLGSSYSRKQKAGGLGGVFRSMAVILPYCKPDKRELMEELADYEL